MLLVVYRLKCTLFTIVLLFMQVTTDLQGVYVCDMGIAKVKQVSEATVTSVSKGPGTYPYMAPEMF